MSHITTWRSSDAAQKKFMKLTSSKQSKAIIINTAGSYIYSCGKLCDILLCRKIPADLDPSGDEKDYILGNFSSMFGSTRPHMISMPDNGATILFFTQESEIPADIKSNYHTGTLFIAATPATPSLNSYFPAGKETIPHVLVSVLVNLTIDGE